MSSSGFLVSGCNWMVWVDLGGFGGTLGKKCRSGWGRVVVGREVTGMDWGVEENLF